MPDVVVNHILLHIKVHDETCGKHEGMLFYKGGVCDTHEIQGKSRELLGFRYIGHSDLYYSKCGMSHVWYTPGGQQV